MIYTIANPDFEVGIHSVGAELCSFKSKQTGTEFIWKGDERIWGSTAPVLFPIIGALKNNQYTYQGKTYTVPKHGFIRHHAQLMVNAHTGNSITIGLKSSPETLAMFPFEFEFEITFTLIENQLHINHRILNTGVSDMYFSVGGHPAINCPFYANENYTDYRVDFEQPLTLYSDTLSDKGLITGNQIPIIQNQNFIPLTDTIFDNDALIFRPVPVKSAVLKSTQHATEVRFDFEDFSNLGIWAKPRAPFVCIEPWLGVTDLENCTGDLTEKDGILSLGAGEVFNANFSITISEG